MINLDMISARKLFTAAAALPLYLTASAPVLAQNITLCPEGIFGLEKCNAQAGASIDTVIGKIITYLLIAGALVAIIFLIWGGIKWITSGGDKAKVEAAQKTIVGAIIGLIVVFASFLILNIVLNILFKVDNIKDIQPTPLSQ